VKARVRELDLEPCRIVAKQALRLESAAEVRDFVRSAIAPC